LVLFGLTIRQVRPHELSASRAASSYRDSRVTVRLNAFP
jgi:hypothetical protein